MPFQKGNQINKGKISPKRNGKYIPCYFCGRLFYLPKSRLKKRRFCSQQCFGKNLVGKKGKNRGFKNGNWKGGRKMNYWGYIEILNKPNKYIPEHRLIMEKYLGRKLKKTEIVHHLNSNPSDNRITNLKLFPNQNEHQRFHRLNKI